MASKPTVTLEFAGDERKLTDAMDRVGTASRSMGDQVDSSSRAMTEGSGRLDKYTEATDTAEARSTGFADTLSGVTDGMAAWNDESLSGTEKMIAMGQAGADLAGGLTNFLLPALASVATFLRTGLASAMSFVAAHPLALALIALAAIFVLLWTRSETFRNVVIGVFNAVWSFIRNTAGAVVGWVVDRWNGMVDFFRNLPNRIGNAIGSLGRILGNVFKGAFNIAIDAINWFIDRANDAIYGINVVSPFADVPYLGHIARLHTGGRVPGMPGQEVLTILQAGDQVSTAASAGDGAAHFTGNLDTALATLIMKMVRDGDIVLGART